MNNWLAQSLSATISQENEHFYFLHYEATIFRLPKSEGEHAIGESVTGFAYLDKDDHARLTTMQPAATTEKFGWGRVVEVRRDLGVFVAIGLPDKDVVVSLDDLPLLPEGKNEWPQKGDQLYIKLRLDKKERLWGHLAWQEDFWALSGRAYDNMQNENLRAIVYRNKTSGSFVYLPDNNMLGFIHPQERTGVLRIGQELMVRVIGFRREDQSLNLSARPRSYEMLGADSGMILAYLENMGGRMPFHDKSTPTEIQAVFGISKGQFKKALGTLMKAGKVRQTADGTELLSSSDKK